MAREKHPGWSKAKPKSVEVVNARPRSMVMEDRVAGFEEKCSLLEMALEDEKEMNQLFKKRIDDVNKDLEKVHKMLNELTTPKGPKIWKKSDE